MNNRIPFLFLLILILLVSCDSPNNQVVSNETTDQGLTYVDRVAQAVAQSFSNRNLQLQPSSRDHILHAIEEPVVFLRVADHACDPCVVSSIDELKKFSKEYSHIKTYLIYRFETEREERIFINQYQLDDIKTLNLVDTELSIIDETGITYFGYTSKGVIKEILPVDQLMPSLLIQEFLKLSF